MVDLLLIGRKTQTINDIAAFIRQKHTYCVYRCSCIKDNCYAPIDLWLVFYGHRRSIQRF